MEIIVAKKYTFYTKLYRKNALVEVSLMSQIQVKISAKISQFLTNVS